MFGKKLSQKKFTFFLCMQGKGFFCWIFLIFCSRQHLATPTTHLVSKRQQLATPPNHLFADVIGEWSLVEGIGAV
jgi:hypothetical protein